MSHKFTADGRKVAIIGALNAKETIVQEIFVTDGTEFPAGEHFVVKTLLDAPAETYKAKEERRILEDIKKHEIERDRLKTELADYRFKAAAAVAKVKWIEHISEDEIREVFDNLKAMLCGEYTHVVLPSSEIEIMEWDHKLFTSCDDYGRGLFENLKMISLFGNRNRRLGLNWRVNSYGDGSGSSRQFIPCKSLQEAIDESKAVIDAKPHLSDHDFKFCVKYGITVDEAKNTVRLAMKSKYIQDRIATNKEQLEKLEADLEAIC
jgi:hypothetical protein